MFVTVSTAFCVYFVKHVLAKVFTPLIRPVLKDQDDEEMIALRTKKANAYFYKTVYYTIVTVWGYIIMKD